MQTEYVLKLGTNIATILEENDKIISYNGERFIIDIISPMFDSRIHVQSGRQTTSNNIPVMSESDKVIVPGQKGFVLAVLLNRVQPYGIGVSK